ncbi:F-box protein 34 L homeolog [Xenopus laevis]|uniref:F-box protein 34 L homeolog n=1 Tax=Xenopus laevis TaxID=8355 RepID=A2RV62_XENLA|nr:F-box protein 34 L homeolog [Xenopus laevis]AAI33193.1 LOC100037134 protein [Xenopus laevis]
MHLNNQGSANQEKYNGATKSCLPSAENQARRPLGAISQNTMCNTVSNSPATSFKCRAKNVPSATIHQVEEDEGSLDICAIIKPGNTKEKIAFFAAHHCTNNKSSSMKIKSSGDMNGRAAKRRKKSVDLKRIKSQLEKMQEAHKKCFLPEPLHNGVDNCSVNFVTGGEGILPSRPLSVIEMVAFLEQRANTLLSAKPFTNYNPSRFTGTSKCAIPASVSLLTLRTCERQTDKDSSEKTEQLESVCVLEMVAKLESECLRHQNERDSGSLSRSNSFRRNVGRMLLASGSQQDNSDSQNVPTAGSETDANVAASSMEDQIPPNKEEHLVVKSWENCLQIKPHEMESMPPAGDTCVGNVDLELVRETYMKIRNRCDIAVSVNPCTFSFSLRINAVECGPDSPETPSGNTRAAEESVGSFDRLSDSCAEAADILMHTFSDQEVECTQDKALILPGDPCPGTLFFQCDQSGQNHARVQLNAEVKSQAEVLKANAFDSALRLQNSSFTAQYAVSVSPLESESQVLDTSVKRPVSHGFLETRFKIQQLLEPQQYMAFLPHHILVKIFRFLPTRTLAALKCTSCYFKFIIEHYDIRPCDSLWVQDPRYKDDPCKQCKRKYAKGDVSLCWWHPKPYCQALPYGPGYWMCCHMSYKESRGCKVGLHDNRWVPACHSFNRTICKKSKESESEED